MQFVVSSLQVLPFASLLVVTIGVLRAHVS